MELLTPPNITFAIGVLALIFSAYNYLRNPQIESDKNDALLEQQAKFTIESNQDRFNSMQASFNALLLQSNNHIHTVDTKVEGLNNAVNKLTNELTKLGTIIEERIPKKDIL